MNKNAIGEKIMGIICMIIGITATYSMLKVSFTEPIKENLINVVGLLVSLPWIVAGFFLLKYESTQENKKQKRNTTITTKYKMIKTVPDSDGGFDYHIVTSWVNQEDNKLYLFSSNTISMETADFVEKSDIKEYPVTYEYNNIKNYEMDISKVKEVHHEED